MKKTEQGYVYILTNPSFKKDWVKIGESYPNEELSVAISKWIPNKKNSVKIPVY